MTLHHKQMFSNNDIEANNNNVTFKTNLSNSMGPALLVLASTISISLLALFFTAMITHFAVIVNLLYYALYVIAGLAGILGLAWVSKTVWIWFGHAAAEWDFSRAQKRRNSVYSVGQNHVVYDTSQPVAVAQLAQRITQNYRDQDAPTIVDADPSQLSNAPSFYELTHASNGLIIKLARENQSLEPADKKFVWGYTSDGPRILKFGDVRSVAISGMNGTGKTVTLGFISSQAALYGFELVLVDEHLGHKEAITNFLKGLQNRMVCEPVNGENSEQTFRLVANELKVRKQNPDEQYKPWLFVIDELPGLIRGSKRTNPELVSFILETLTDLNDQGRKYGLFVIAAGQRWKQASSGSADFRQSFPAQIQHKNAASEIELLLGCTATEAGVGVKLQKGQVIMCDSIDTMVLQSIPLTTPDDVDEVSRIANAMYGVSLKIVEMPTKRPRNAAEMPEIPMRNTDEMAWEAKIEMFRDLMSQNAPKVRYMTEIWGAKPGDNAKYRKFLDEYDQILDLVTQEEDSDRVQVY